MDYIHVEYNYTNITPIVISYGPYQPPQKYIKLYHLFILDNKQIQEIIIDIIQLISIKGNNNINLFIHFVLLNIQRICSWAIFKKRAVEVY